MPIVMAGFFLFCLGVRFFFFFNKHRKGEKKTNQQQQIQTKPKTKQKKPSKLRLLNLYAYDQLFPPSCVLYKDMTLQQSEYYKNV